MPDEMLILRLGRFGVDWGWKYAGFGQPLKSDVEQQFSTVSIQPAPKALFFRAHSEDARQAPLMPVAKSSALFVG